MINSLFSKNVFLLLVMLRHDINRYVLPSITSVEISDLFLRCLLLFGTPVSWLCLSLSRVTSHWSVNINLSHVNQIDRQWSVALHVQREMVGAGKCSLTDVTLERFVSRVFPEVTCQLIRARKPPGAALPVTNVRLLT